MNCLGGVIGFLLIFMLPKYCSGNIGGLLVIAIGIIIGVLLIGYGARKYRAAKRK